MHLKDNISQTRMISLMSKIGLPTPAESKSGQTTKGEMILQEENWDFELKIQSPT